MYSKLKAMLKTFKASVIYIARRYSDDTKETALYAVNSK